MQAPPRLHPLVDAKAPGDRALLLNDKKCGGACLKCDAAAYAVWEERGTRLPPRLEQLCLSQHTQARGASVRSALASGWAVSHMNSLFL